LNTRLLNVLDVSAELILLINDQLHVVYSNERAAKSFSDDTQAILGMSVVTMLKDELVNQLRKMLDIHSACSSSLEIEGANKDTRWQVSIKRLEQKGRIFLALVILPVSVVNSSETDPTSVITGLTLELCESRKKIDQIEGALKQLVYVSDPLETTHKDNVVQESELPQTSGALANKEVIVTLHRTTLHLWERYTNKGKAELAERSRCWRVYLDGTTIKTRTFDKYLNVKSVPDRPRWRAVVRTAYYVLANCELSDEDRANLTQLSSSVEDFYS